MTLTEFLLARIAEDEARARPAWEARVARRLGGLDVPPAWPTPDRVLAECEVKRRIVALHGPANLDDDGTVSRYSDPTDARYCAGCNATFTEEYAELIDTCPTKRLLALPYADHPNYRDEWRPA